MTEGHPRSSKVAQGQSPENMYFEECDITEDDPRSTKVIQGRPRTKSEKLCIVKSVRPQKMAQGQPRSSKVIHRQSQECVYLGECTVTEYDRRPPTVTQGRVVGRLLDWLAGVYKGDLGAILNFSKTE